MINMRIPSYLILGFTFAAFGCRAEEKSDCYSLCSICARGMASKTENGKTTTEIGDNDLSRWLSKYRPGECSHDWIPVAGWSSKDNLSWHGVSTWNNALDYIRKLSPIIGKAGTKKALDRYFAILELDSKEKQVEALNQLVDGLKKPTLEVASSPLAQIKLSVGMTRWELEELVSKATGVKKKYNIYTENRETKAEYRDGSTLLVVQFNPGLPAPWVKTDDGRMKHLPPKDSTVKSWRFERMDAGRKEADDGAPVSVEERKIPPEVQEAVALLLKGGRRPDSPEVKKALKTIHSFEEYTVIHDEIIMDMETKHRYHDYYRRFPTLRIHLRYFDDRFMGQALAVTPSDEPQSIFK